MTPEQLVDEWCAEWVQHGYDINDKYSDLLEDYISRDPIKAMYPAARIIDQYDPTTSQGRSKTKGNRADAAQTLLGDLDETVIRLRGSAEGRIAMESLRRLVQRMEAAHFNAADTSDQWRRGRYEILVPDLREMEGMNICDEVIRDTLRIRHNIAMSDQAMLQFVNYLVSKDPSYPGWSKAEEYTDLTRRNEAGNPLGFRIMKNPEPFYRAYLEYQAASNPG
jgi:hypothetical protein